MIQSKMIHKTFAARGFWGVIERNPSLIVSCPAIPMLFNIVKTPNNYYATHWERTPNARRIFTVKTDRVQQYKRCLQNVEILQKKYDIVQPN